MHASAPTREQSRAAVEMATCPRSLETRMTSTIAATSCSRATVKAQSVAITRATCCAQQQVARASSFCGRTSKTTKKKTMDDAARVRSARALARESPSRHQRRAASRSEPMVRSRRLRLSHCRRYRSYRCSQQLHLATRTATSSSGFSSGTKYSRRPISTTRCLRLPCE